MSGGGGPGHPLGRLPLFPVPRNDEPLDGRPCVTVSGQVYDRPG